MRLLARAAAFIAAVVIIPFLAAAPAAAVPAPDEESAPVATIGERLASAADGGATAPEELAAELSLPAEGAGSLFFDEEQRVSATVVLAAAPDATMLAAVGQYAEVGPVLGRFPVVSVWMDPALVDDLKAVPGVVDVLPDLAPATGGSARLAAAPAVASGDACNPLPIEADGPLGSAEARERFGVDGTGVTIGIISDSFDHVADPLTTWADDVAAGVLPGAGNPCGYTTDIEILGHEGPGGADEGRAMAQLVHGIAPGARILFASTGTNLFEMAANIMYLADAGADVIVDDITFLTETYFQRGPISASIEEVTERGVLYFTSAGNQNVTSTTAPEDSAFGHTQSDVPIGAWQTDAFRGMDCPDWVVADADDPLQGTAVDCLDFDPGAAEQAYDQLRIGDVGSADPLSLSVTGSIGEPMFGVTTRYEVRFYEPQEGADPALIGRIASLGGIYPGLIGSVTVPERTMLRMVVVRIAPDSSTPALHLRFTSGAEIIDERQFIGDGVHDQVGGTAFGHSGDGSAIGTASLTWDNPVRLRPYSSLGSVELRFATVQESLLPSPALPAPLRIDAPQLAAVDGTQTTFFGKEEDGARRFYGTSAAAPNAAAVAALSLEYAPVDGAAEGDARRELILATARGTDEGGPVNPYLHAGFPDERVFGAGIVDARRLLAALPVPAPTGLGLAEGGATATTLAVLWDGSDAPGSYVIELLATSAESPLQRAELPFGSTTHTFEGLMPDTAYTVRLTPRTDAAEPGATAQIELRTAAAPGPSPSPEPDPAGPPATDATAALAATGDASPVPWLLGGGAVLIALAVLLIAWGRVRSRRRDGEATETDAGPEA